MLCSTSVLLLFNTSFQYWTSSAHQQTDSPCPSAVSASFCSMVKCLCLFNFPCRYSVRHPLPVLVSSLSLICFLFHYVVFESHMQYFISNTYVDMSHDGEQNPSILNTRHWKLSLTASTCSSSSAAKWNNNGEQAEPPAERQPNKNARHLGIEAKPGEKYWNWTVLKL